jgi:hypothetical protein
MALENRLKEKNGQNFTVPNFMKTLIFVSTVPRPSTVLVTFILRREWLSGANVLLDTGYVSSRNTFAITELHDSNGRGGNRR